MIQLVDNERTKLLANALDRASMACLTVGVLAPLAALLYNLSAGHIEIWVFVGGGVICFPSRLAYILLQGGP